MPSRVLLVTRDAADVRRVADLLAERRRTGLAGRQDVAAEVAERGAERLQEARLARPVRPFEGDERAPNRGPILLRHDPSVGD